MPVRVLLVDDDEDEYVIATDLLRSVAAEQFHLTWAATYDQGLKSILSSDFDVCLVDYRLGAQNGLELMREAAREPLDIQFILLTGEGDREVDLNAMRCGAADYLVKAELTSALLERAIRYAVERGRTLRELRSATQAAENSSRAKSLFLAAMSHEIRTPMNAILGMADLLWETELTSSQREYAARFRRAGSHLLTLIDDLLDLSKIESERFELKSVSFSVPDLIQETSKMMTPLALAKNLRLEARILPGTPHLLVGDPVRLDQILHNLVGNAIKFTNSGSVVLTAKAHPDNRPGHLQFSLEDTGIGIPADRINAIFEDFTQAESSTTHRFGGTGLGLGICRRLVQRMGGELLVESVFGEGSTFRFDVFLKLDESTPKAEVRGGRDSSQDRVLVAGDSDPMEILIAEDSEDNRFLLVEYLKNGPYALTFAENGLAAVEAFAKKNFELVLMDVQMPTMDGLAAAARIRVQERQSGKSFTPIVALTANALPEDIRRTEAAGCNAHLSKPLSKQRLIATVESFRSKPAVAKSGPKPVIPPKPVYHIEIPEGLEELSRAYIGKRKAEIPRMRQLSLSEGFDEIRIFGHNLKGTGTSYGFSALTNLGAAIEKDAKATDRTSLCSHLAEVNDYIEYASHALRRPC